MVDSIVISLMLTLAEQRPLKRSGYCGKRETTGLKAVKQDLQDDKPAFIR